MATIIEIKTGSQPGDSFDGKFSYQFYSPDGSCTVDLDNPQKNDLELGAVDLFSGDMLGPCENFQPDLISAVKITHRQGDNWRGEYLKISYGKKSFTCNLGKILENKASITFPCNAPQGNKLSHFAMTLRIKLTSQSPSPKSKANKIKMINRCDWNCHMPNVSNRKIYNCQAQSPNP